MSEKAISIGQYFVASGVYTLFGITWPTSGSELLTNYLFEGIEEELRGMWDFEADPELAAKMMIAHIDKKRKALGLDKARERVLFDMDMRRKLRSRRRRRVVRQAGAVPRQKRSKRENGPFQINSFKKKEEGGSNMSKIIISAAIRGAQKIFDKCAAKLE